MEANAEQPLGKGALFLVTRYPYMDSSPPKNEPIFPEYVQKVLVRWVPCPQYTRILECSWNVGQFSLGELRVHGLVYLNYLYEW